MKTVKNLGTRENVSVVHLTAKGLVSRWYKELLQIMKKRGII